MKRRVAVIAFLIAVSVGLGVLRYGVFGHVGPGRTNPPFALSETLEETATPTAEAQAIVDRACRDCHTNRTVWPWYSRLPPVSWLVIDHVNHGRSHLNFSRWATYPPADKRRLLEGVCKLASKQEMPVPSYLFMHEEARLATGDVNALCAWARSEAERLDAAR